MALHILKNEILIYPIFYLLKRDSIHICIYTYVCVHEDGDYHLFFVTLISLALFGDPRRVA